MSGVRFSSSSLPSVEMSEASGFHVLAVDDSLVDRKLIESLLRVSSYRGDSSISSGTLWLLGVTGIANPSLIAGRFPP